MFHVSKVNFWVWLFWTFYNVSSPSQSISAYFILNVKWVRCISNSISLKLPLVEAEPLSSIQRFVYLLISWIINGKVYTLYDTLYWGFDHIEGSVNASRHWILIPFFFSLGSLFLSVVTLQCATMSIMFETKLNQLFPRTHHRIKMFEIAYGRGN